MYHLRLCDKNSNNDIWVKTNDPGLKLVKEKTEEKEIERTLELGKDYTFPYPLG